MHTRYGMESPQLGLWSSALPCHKEGPGGATIGGDGARKDLLVVAKVPNAVVAGGRGWGDGPQDSC